MSNFVSDIGKKIGGVVNDLTGQTGSDAAAAGLASQTEATNKATGLIQDTTNQGLGINADALTKSLAATGKSYTDATGALNTGANNAIDALNTGYGTAARTTAPWLQAGTSALSAQQSLMGLGANGSQGAIDALKSSPNYQFGLDQGNRALDASSAARGGMGSGKALQAAQSFGTDYAGNVLNNRFNQLNTVQQQGQAAGNTLGGYAMSNGNNVAGIDTGLASGLASAATNYGSNVSNLYGNNAANNTALLGNQASSLSGLYTGLGNASAAASMAGAQSKQNATGNLLGTGLSALATF